MLREETQKDAMVVDNIFSQYENLKDQDIKTVDEKQINDFLKSILKVIIFNQATFSIKFQFFCLKKKS